MLPHVSLGANQVLNTASTTPRLRPQASVLAATAADIGLGTTAIYMQRTTSGAAGNGLYTTIKYMRGAAGIGLGTKIKHLRRAASGSAGNGLGAAMKYLRRSASAAANNCLSTTAIPPCCAASFEVNSKPHTGARPSVRLCVGPELARGVHQ
jgi:hypothetical protein